MKTKALNLIVIALASVTAAFTGCKLIGANPTPPSALEAKAFDITTNFVPQIVTKTNVVTTTNVVNVPSPFPMPVFQTNILTATNIVTQTNQVAQYDYTPKPAAVATIQGAGTVAGPFTAGIGTMVSSGLVLLYGIWAHLRSSKKGDTALALTQEIEAVRDYILTLPQGTKIDAAVTQFMQQHQTEAGVAQEVLSLIKGNSSDPTVVGVAANLQAAINSLTSPTPPKT